MRKYTILFVLIVLIIMFIVVGCGAAGIGLPEEDIHAVEEKVIVGDFVWEILEVEDLGTELVFGTFVPGEPEERRIIGVTFMVQNTSTEPRILFDLTVIDSEGLRNSICLEAFGFVSSDQVCVLQEVIPGVENIYTAAFAVGTDVTRLVLEVTDLSGSSLEVAYIDLEI